MTTENVIKEVCNYAGITDEALCMPRRYSCKVTWRRICAYIMYDYCGATQQHIANSLGYAQHENAKFHVEKLRHWMNNQDQAPRDEVLATRNILFKLGAI